MNHLFETDEKQIDFIDINLSFDEDGKNILTNPLELFLQELYLSLMLAPGDIWGVTDSLDLNKYLFSRYLTDSYINTEIQSYIRKHCHHASLFNYTVNTEIAPDNHGNEMVLINMEIYDVDGTKILKSFVLGNEQTLID